MQKDANREYKAYYMQWLDELSFSLLGTLNYDTIEQGYG